MRPARSASPLFSTREYPALSPISGPLPYGCHDPVEPETVLPRAAIRAFCRRAAAYAPGLTAIDDAVRCASCWFATSFSVASPVVGGMYACDALRVCVVVNAATAAATARTIRIDPIRLRCL